MATGMTLSALEKISDHLECSICQERYKRPKVLDCQHSFCEHCLEEYYSRYRGGPKIPCPMCRQEMVLPERGVQGLKTNFHLIGLVEEISLQEKVACLGNTKVICEICEDGNEAMHRCLDCAQNICLNCRKTHLRCTATSSHTIVTLEDIRQGKVEVKKTPEEDGSKCHKHKGEVARFYCESCQELICRDCAVIDHRETHHHYTDSATASLKYKQTLEAAFPAFNKHINTCEQYLAAASQARMKYQKKINATIREVQDRTAKISAEVTNQENRIIDEIKHLQQDRNQTFDGHEKTVSMMLQRNQHSLETAKDVTNNASDCNFLSLYPTISTDLKLLSSQNPPKLDSKLSYLMFNQGQNIDDISLGELVVEVSKWELGFEFGKGKSVAAAFNVARGIAATQAGAIAVADYGNKRVVICSTMGHHQGNIQMQEFPTDIAAIHNQLVVVDNSKYVKMFNQDRKLAFQFPTVPHSEVDKTEVDLYSVAAKKDGTIIVGDIKRMVLTEHSPTDGALLRTIPVKTEPSFLAVDSFNDRVFISGYKQEVDGTDNNGVALFTISPTIDGQPVAGCRGVCCDSSGIYIAMSNGLNTGHIHHYDADGEFLNCLAQGLYDPMGITFTSDGQLAMADWCSVKTYHKL